jgi:hypothetical protein
VAFALQQRSKPFPAPRTTPRTMHQGKRRHTAIVLARIPTMCEKGIERTAARFRWLRLWRGVSTARQLAPIEHAPLPAKGGELHCSTTKFVANARAREPPRR